MKYVSNVLELSTWHLPSDCESFYPLRYANHQYGYIVWITEHSEFEVDTWLKPIVKMAVSKKCSMINFDRDADVVESLKKYDW